MGHLLFEKRGSVGLVTFNRPEALNALNSETLNALDDILDAIEKDDSIRCIVFTGTGKAFIAGADIKEMESLTAEQGRAFSRLGQEVFDRVEKLEKVTIAAVNGFALGGGCEMALCCDIRIASEKARFGQPEVTLGITPGFGGTQRLPKMIGVSKAKQLIFTGDMIDANKALEFGLVSEVCENAVTCAMTLADKIASRAPLAVQYSKMAIDQGLNMGADSGSRIESQVFGLCFATEDQKNGMRAFVEKSKIEFRGK